MNSDNPKCGSVFCLSCMCIKDRLTKLESQNALLLKVLVAGEEHVKTWHRERANINNILGCTEVDYLHFFDPCHKPINRHSLEESIRAYRASESEGK